MLHGLPWYKPCHIGPPKMDGSWWRALRKRGPLEKGMANHFSILPWEPHEHYEKAKRWDIKNWAPQLVSAQYATGEEQRNSCRKNEEAEPKLKQCAVVDVSGSETKGWCYKEQSFTGAWNIRSMNQGKLEVVNREMARVNIDILGISDLK